MKEEIPIASIRRKAEDLLKKQKARSKSKPSETEIMRLVHELEVHQIELELVNEELVLAKEQAEIAAKKYTELYNYAPMGYFTLSKEGVIIEINSAAAKMLGKDQSQLIGRRFVLYVSDDSKANFNVTLGKVFDHNENEICDIDLKTDGNNLIYVQLSGIRAQSGDFCYVTAVDITKLKRSQEALQSSESKLRHAHQIAKMGSWEWDPYTDEVVYTNEIFDIFGIEKENFKGNFSSMVDSLIHPEDRDLVQKVTDIAKQTGIGQTVEYRIIRPDGQTCWIRAIGEFLYKNGKLIKMFGVNQDITNQKQAEDALHESEVKYRNLVETSSDIIWETNMEGKYTYVNPKSENILGYKSDEVIGHSPFEFMPSDEAIKIKKISDKIIASKKPFEGLININLNKDGREVIFETSGVPYFDEKNTLLGYRGVDRDITERKQAEEAIKESELRYRSLFENSLMGISLADKHGRFSHANESYAKMYGYNSLEELINSGVNVSDFYAKQEQRSEVINILNEKGVMEPREFEVVHRNGSHLVFMVTAMVIKDKEGKPQYYQAYQIDITDRKLAEKKIKESEEKYRLLVEASGIGVALYGIDGKILFFNKKAIQNMGGKPEDYIGKSLTEVFGEKAGSIYKHRIQLAAQSETNQEYEDYVETKSGNYWFLSNHCGIKGLDGKIIGVQVIANDITERKQAEEAFTRSKELLSETEKIGKVGGWEFNIDTMEQVWTEEVYRIHEVGLDYNPNVNKGISFYTTESRPVIELAIQRVKELSEPFDLELEIITAKGNRRNIHAIGKADMEHHRVYGFIQDITDRIKSEQALRENEELLSLFIKNSPIYTYIKEVTADQSRVLTVSDNFIEMVGIPAAEMIGKTMKEIFPSEFAAQMETDDKKVVTEGKILQLEEYLNGRNYNTIKFPITIGGKKLLAGYTIDITERKQAEQILAKKNKELGILNQFSVKLAMLSSDDNLEATITQTIKEITGAETVIYSEYNVEERTTTVKEIETKPGFLKIVAGLLDNQIKNMQSPVSDELYLEMTTEIIGMRKTLHEASFGTVSHPVSSAIQALLKIDRFIGVAYMLEGVLYGTSLLTMKKDQPDVSKEILESIAYLAAVSLRRRKAEKALKESESSLRFAQEIAQMGSWEWELKTQKVKWSDNYYSFFRMNPLEVEPSYELFHKTIYPDDLALYNENYVTLFNEKKPQAFDIRVILPNGTIKWTKNYVVPFVEDGKIVKLKGAFVDITDLKQAEKITYNIIEKNPMSIQIIDKDGFTLQTNPAHTKLFGAIPPPDFSIFNDAQLIRQGLTETFKQLRSGKVVNFPDAHYNAHELNPSFPDNNIWVRAMAFPLFENEKVPEQYVLMHENITEYKKYELALKESEEKYRNIFENVQDVFIQTDLDGIVNEISPSIKYFTEFSQDEIVGKPVQRLYYYPDERINMVNELQKKGELKDYELILKTKKGEKKYVSINARLIFDDLGIPHHIDGAIRDISERKIAESELIKAHEQLKLLFRHQENIRENERTKISREIHDELGQSLSALKVDLGWARDNVSDNSTVVNKLNNMFGIISDTIENVQRISAELRPGLLDDLGLIPAMEWYCQEFEERTKIKCIFISEEILIFNNNKELSLYRMLQEALTNVMRHALASKVQVNFYVEKNSVILKIKDDGIGIPFEKINSGKSLGIIGLRERANQFNGSLKIISAKDKGTELIIILPFDQSEITKN